MGNGKQGQHGAHKVLKHMKGYMMLHDMPIVTDEKFGADVHSPVKSHIKGHADPPKKKTDVSKTKNGTIKPPAPTKAKGINPTWGDM